ncbi:hypothetical protein H2248_003128 [Termitomyces sp. 'cryptogamus']|nr:hypothetical protein H2248_003128 [Termitomyces sp. 'cryptogamus']
MFIAPPQQGGAKAKAKAKTQDKTRQDKAPTHQSESHTRDPLQLNSNFYVCSIYFFLNDATQFRVTWTSRACHHGSGVGLTALEPGRSMFELRAHCNMSTGRRRVVDTPPSLNGNEEKK